MRLIDIVAAIYRIMHRNGLNLLIVDRTVNGIVLLFVADDARDGCAATRDPWLSTLIALLTIIFGLNRFIYGMMQILVALLREHLQGVGHEQLLFHSQFVLLLRLRVVGLKHVAVFVLFCQRGGARLLRILVRFHAVRPAAPMQILLFSESRRLKTFVDAIYDGLHSSILSYEIIPRLCIII